MTPNAYPSVLELPPAIGSLRLLQDEAAAQGRQHELQQHRQSILQTLNDLDQAATTGQELLPLQDGTGAFRLWVTPPLTVCFAVRTGEEAVKRERVWVHHYGAVPPWPRSGPPPRDMQFHWLLGGYSTFNDIRQQARDVGREPAFQRAYGQIVRQLQQPEQAIRAGKSIRALGHPQAQIRLVIQGFLWVYYVVYPVERVGFFFRFEAPGWLEEEGG